MLILPTNGAEAIVIVFAILIGMTLPITPVQILWINIVTAITLVIYIAFEPMEETTMEMLPRDFKASITGGYFHFRILYVEGRIRGITAYFINSRKIHESILTHGFFKKIVSIASGVLIVFLLAFNYLHFI